VRIEVGPRDMQNEQAVLVRRDTGEKTNVAFSEIRDKVSFLLTEIQKDLFAKALAFQKEHTHTASDFDECVRIFETDSGFVEAPWCGSEECETKMKDATKATIRVLPFDQKPSDSSCVVCNGKAKYTAVFAKAY
jgi:prolyl-tRNA synthetase